MTLQTWLFTAGCVLGTLGALMALTTARAPDLEPKPAPVAGLMLMVLGLAVTVAGACAG